MTTHHQLHIPPSRVISIRKLVTETDPYEESWRRGSTLVRLPDSQLPKPSTVTSTSKAFRELDIKKIAELYADSFISAGPNGTTT